MAATTVKEVPQLPRLPIKILALNATREDVQRTIAVNKGAFGPDPLIEACFNRPGVENESEEAQIKTQLDRMAKPGMMYHKAVDPDDPDGKILGSSFWWFCDSPETATPNSPWGSWPAGAHMELVEKSLGMLNNWRHDHFAKNKQPYVFLGTLAVSTEAQRRGVGTALLRAGIEECEKKGLPIYLDASPAGLGLYERLGWKRVVTNSVNLKDFGGADIVCPTVGLIRQPGSGDAP